jgi:catechol O-methyltransferase
MPKSTDLLKYVMTNSIKGDAQNVLDVIDKFCSEQWMMNIGNLKGLILDDEVVKKAPARVLEIGTYCGYSAIRIARLLADGAHLYTLEINIENIKVAQQIITQAGLTNKITFVNSNLEKYIETMKAPEPFDLIFIDHWKDQYLSDFRILEIYGLIKPGTVIVADNILYPGAPDYKAYLMSNGDYENVCYETLLEYTSNIKDQVLVSVRKPDYFP